MLSFWGFRWFSGEGEAVSGASEASILDILGANFVRYAKNIPFYKKLSFKIPKFRTSRKISAFSFKEIDRSLLLEDFLRKAEIVYSGGF